VIRLAWSAAEAVVRSTARVEADAGAGWQRRGTAFFVADDTLLSCAHVVWPGEQVRVVWHGAGGRLEVPVKVERKPALDAPTGQPYPLPDLMVLKAAPGVLPAGHPAVWLSEDPPQDDLWAFGYTDEYREGVALGHAARFQVVGEVQADEQEPSGTWRMKGDRVRPGMSGAPVLDLLTGRVVGIVKRTADPNFPLGAWFTPMKVVRPAIPEVAAANKALFASPEFDDRLAAELWGELVTVAAAPLADNTVVRAAIAQAVGLQQSELIGDEAAQARCIARRLFLLELEELVDLVSQLRTLAGDAAPAASVFEAAAICTTYQSEQWLAADAAAELAAQVDALARRKITSGRVLHLRCLPELRRRYVRRGNFRNEWQRPLACTLFSHELDEATQLPKELEQELRAAIVRRFPNVSELQPLAEPELDEAGRAKWDKRRPQLVAKLRRGRVVGLLPPHTALDGPLVQRLADQYPLVFVAASGEAPAAAVLDEPAFQAIDPDVDDDLAFDAFLTYDSARSSLGVPEEE
jgi:hypothetical protein